VNAAFGILDVLMLSEVVVAVVSEPKVGTTLSLPLSIVEVTVNSFSPADVDISSIFSGEIGSDVEGAIEVPACAVLATLVVASGMSCGSGVVLCLSGNLPLGSLLGEEGGEEGGEGELYEQNPSHCNFRQCKKNTRRGSCRCKAVC